MYRLRFFYGTIMMFVILSLNLFSLKANGSSILFSGTHGETIENFNSNIECKHNNANFIFNKQNLIVMDTVITRDTFAICRGDSIEIFGQLQHQAGDYQITHSTEEGEFTHIIALEILDTFHTTEHISLCAGHFIKIGNQVIFTGGTYTLELTAENGCDSLHTMIVTAIDTIFTRDTVILCKNDSLEINGTFIHQAGDYSSTYVAASGCDSTHTTYVELLDALETHETATICYGESMEVFGLYQVASGIFSDTLTAFSGCDSIHFVELLVLDSLRVDLEGDFNCRNENNAWMNAEVHGGLAPYDYQWSMSADNSPHIQDLSGGHYYLTVTDAQGCRAVAALELEFSAAVLLEIEPLEVSCFGESDGEFTVIPLVANLQFSLDGVYFQTNPIFTDLAAGTYTLYTRDENGCIYEEMVDIKEPNEIYVQLPPDTTLRIGHSLQIFPMTNTRYIENYEWTPTTYLDCTNCPYPTATPQEDSSYELTITDENGCTATDMMTIFVDKTPLVYIPNAFSPNDDGENDVFMIFTNPAVFNIQTFRLFDRWGEMVYQAENFSPNDPSYGWDGSFNGTLMTVGVYAYFAEIELLDGEVVMYKGDVTLVR